MPGLLFVPLLRGNTGRWQAEAIANALGGHRAGGGWAARCPAHDYRLPSLSISDAPKNKVLVHCHAGCDQGRVIVALRARGLWHEKRREASSQSVGKHAGILPGLPPVASKPVHLTFDCAFR